MFNAINAGVVTVPPAGSTAVLIVAARPGRGKVRILGDVYIGADSNVTSDNGYRTNDGIDGSSGIELATDAAIYGVAASSASVPIRFLELFNT